MNMHCFMSAAPNSTLWTEKTKGKCCGSHTEHRIMSARDRKERKNHRLLQINPCSVFVQMVIKAKGFFFPYI